MRSLLVSATCLLFGFALFAEGDAPINENPVHVQAQLSPTTIKQGGSAELLIDVTVDAGHHAYRDMLKIKWPDGEGTVGEIKVAPVHMFNDPFSKKQREAIEGQGTVKAEVKLPDSMPLGAHETQVKFTYQACSATYCLFPKTLTLPIKYTIVSASGISAPSLQAGDFSSALAKGTVWAYFFVFLAGILTSFTPCVFPMIPITISIIGARSAGTSRLRSMTLSIFYVLGIATTYSTLGVVAASTGMLFGSFLGNVYVAAAIGIVFVLMALSMMGLFEIQAPSFIRNRIGTASTGSGFFGAYLAGLFAGIVASPCIGPVLVSILTFVAQTAQAFYGFTLLFVFALGLGMIFIVLGTFTGLISKLPKSGPWMDAVKNIFGITFFGVALYYVYPVFSKAVFDVLLGLTIVGFAGYLGAFKQVETKREQVAKGFVLSAFFLGVVFIIRPFIDIKGSNSQVAAPEKKPGIVWQEFKDQSFYAAFENAKGKEPIILDFWAEWCAACHELEELTYTDSNVMSEAKRFKLFKIDATTSTPFISDLQKQYGVVGLPTVIFIHSDGKIESSNTVTGFVPAADFLSRMQKIK